MVRAVQQYDAGTRTEVHNALARVGTWDLDVDDSFVEALAAAFAAQEVARVAEPLPVAALLTAQAAGRDGVVHAVEQVQTQQRLWSTTSRRPTPCTSSTWPAGRPRRRRCRVHTGSRKFSNSTIRMATNTCAAPALLPSDVSLTYVDSALSECRAALVVLGGSWGPDLPSSWVARTPHRLGRSRHLAPDEREEFGPRTRVLAQAAHQGAGDGG